MSPLAALQPQWVVLVDTPADQFDNLRPDKLLPAVQADWLDRVVQVDRQGRAGLADWQGRAGLADRQGKAVLGEWVLTGCSQVAALVWTVPYFFSLASYKLKV